MHYKAELDFLLKLLSHMNLKTNILTSGQTNEEIDFGLRRHLHYSKEQYEYATTSILGHLQENRISWYEDELFCNYIGLYLPETESSILLIGPYLSTNVTTHQISELMEHFSVSAKLLPHLKTYYNHLTYIPDNSALVTILNTFGESIWGSLENFQSEKFMHHLPEHILLDASTTTDSDFQDHALQMNIIDMQYAVESALMEAVSQGLVNKAEMIFPLSPVNNIEQRLPDNIRNMKNHSIILNTLLRKAAEQGSVPYFYIHDISSKFAKKIELQNSAKDFNILWHEMARKYSLLVKNHSMKGYSLLIQKVLTAIDANLTADLSLNALAQQQNVNASYLSTLFKKETGMTLTEYVNRKRIKHGIFLLNTTKLQISTIAEHCGIMDVNYFSKIFKKYVNMSPKEYRDQISVLNAGAPSKTNL